MRKPAPRLEWEFAENETDWERRRVLLRPDMPPTPSSSRRPRTRFLWGMAVLLLLLVSVTDWWWRSTEGQAHQAAAQAPATAQRELDEIVPGSDPMEANGMNSQSGWDGWEQDERAQKAHSQSSSLSPDWWYQYEGASGELRLAVQAMDPAAHLNVAVQTVAVQGGYALAQVVSPNERGAPAYRQTRFYRRTPSGGWVQTAPEAALWGPKRSLATPYFVYHFREHDAAVILAVAPQLYALDTALWRHFGPPMIPMNDQLVIEVSVTQPPGQARPWAQGPEGFIVPSPAVYWAPVALNDGKILAQAVALPLLAHGLAQARQRNAIGAAWQPLLRGLYLWQVWDLDLPLAAWRPVVVHWVYHDLPASQPGSAVALPDHYRELCAAHKLWLPAPVEIGIPLVCTERERTDWGILFARRVDALTRLDQLSVPEPQPALSAPYHPDYQPGQTVALATLIEYAVVTYGRERLPILVTGLGHYQTWETLIPAVYGVSAANFEAGWQAYLAAQYGVSVARKSGSE